MAEKSIKFRGEFDASQILASLKSIRSEMEKSGAAPSFFKGIDKDIDKAESLVKELTAAINNGFKDTKDVDNFRKKFETLNQVFSKVGIGLKDLNKTENFTKSTKSLQTLEKQLEKIQTAEAKVAREALEASKNLKGISTKAAREELEKAINAGEDLEKVLKRISEQQFSKGQSSLNKILGKANTTDVTFKNANADSLSANAGLASSFTANPGNLNKYRQALLSLATTSITAKEAFDQFGLELDEEGQKYIQSSEFARAYMEDLKRLSLEAVSTSGMSKSSGAVGKAISTMSSAGVTDASGILHMTAAEAQAIQQYIDLLKQKGIITQEIAQEEAAILAQAVATQQNFNNALLQGNEKQKEFADATENSANSLRNQIESQQNLEASFNKMGSFVKQVFSLTTAWRTFNRVIRSTFNDIKALDKAFGSIAMVTNYSVSDMWQQYSTYAKMANRLGQTTQSVIEASGLYYQQGLKTAEVMKLTEDTMKLATLAGLDFKEATSQMTGALRAFHMEMDQGAHVTDVYSAIAASAAVDVNGISEAMSATAAIAHSAGMSFENTSAMLATMVEATQEAPKNLGTAMKAIIARFTELKTNVAGTADSEFDDLDYNKVDKALKSVGISIKDAAGQFRNLDEVFLELSAKWNTLERNTQRYIATIAAGSRQQSRFIALMENYERTMELIQVADESAGKADQQFAKYSDTVEFKLNRLKNAWEQTKTTIFTSEFYGDLLDIVTKLVEKLEGLDWKKLLIAVPSAMAVGRIMGKSWITGFSQGINGVKNFISGKFTGNTSKTAKQMQQDFYQSKENFKELTGQEAGIKLGKNIDISKTKNYDKLNKKLEETTEKYNTLKKFAEEAAIKNPEVIQQAKQEMEAAQKELNNYEAKTKETFNNLKTEKAELWKKQVWASAASGAAAAAGTALTMGLMGSFDASTIAKTITGQTAVTAVSQLVSGNYIGAGISALIGGVSFGLSQLFDYFEDSKEKLREVNDQAYHYGKIIKEDEEAQKALNDAYNTANNELQKQKEHYDSFNSAKETYEELSKKVLLTTEEQEKLNEATNTLIDLHPELISGYDAQGKAVLKVGEAWDKVVSSEEEYYNKLKEEELTKRTAAVLGQYKIAWDYQQQDKAIKQQKKELYEGYDKYYADKFGARYEDTQLLSINDILNMTTWDVMDSGSSMDAESYVKNLLTGIQSNRAFSEAFLKAYNEEAKKNLTDAEQAYKNIFDLSDNEENELWNKIAENIRKQIDSWKDIDIDTLDETQLMQAAQDYSLIIKERIEEALKGFKGTEEAKKQLVNILAQDAGTTEDINKKLKEHARDGGTLVSPEGLAEEIVGDNSKITKQFEELTDYQNELIGNYISNLGKVSIEESEKEIDKLKQAGIGDKVIDALTEKLDNTEEQGEKIREKIGEIFGYGFDQSNLNKIFSKLPLAIQESLSKVLGGYSNEQANFITHGMEAFLKDFNLSSNSDIFAHLAGIDWKNKSLLDLTATKKEFIEFAKTVDISVEDAEKYWASYKQYMITTGAIDLTKTINADAIVDSLNNKLSEKLKSADGITNAVSTALENGFLNFSESEALKEACEAIGVNISEYLSFNKANNGYSLDVQGLRAAIEESFNEEKIAGEVDALITEKETQLNLLEGYVQRNKAGKDIVKTEYDILQIMEKEAAMAYAIAHGGEVKNISSGIENIQINFKDNDDQQVLDYIEKEREAIEKLDRNKLFQDLADNWQAATAEMLNRYDKIINNSQEKLEEYFKNVQDATEKVEELTVDLDKKNRATQKAWKSYQESLYGTDNYKSSLDPLNNYEAVLDNITYKAKKAKDALEDLEPEDNVGNLLKTYANQVHQEVITRNAENEVIKKAMENTEKNLAQYSQYWQKFGDTYVLNMDKIASAKMPDDLKNEIESQVEQLRKWQKNLRDNEDTLDQLRKDFKESRKKALQSYVDLEKQVVEALKEQYQKEIDDLKNKYDAMSTADEDYLNSLEAAIEKERRLRQRQNEWDDLATKEKKLSLMQRDTSGANQLEVQKLQQEVEKDRTQLLDNTVDDIVNSLKEMYDLQKESREAELEYMESMLDNAELIRQANEIISSWQSSADAVNWFMQAKDLNAMSAAELELEKESWEKLYKAKELYEEQSNLKFDDYLKATQEEINKQLKTISETATTYTTTSMNLVKQKIADAQESALDAYNNAVDAEKKAKEALQEAQNLLLKLQLELPPALVELVGATLAAANSVYTKTVTGSSGISSFMRGVMDTVSGSHQSDNVIDTYSSNKNNSNIGSEQAKYQEEKGTNSYINSYKDTVGWFVGQAYDWSSKKPDGGIGQLQPEIYQYIRNNPKEFADMIRTQTGYTGEVYIHFDDKNKSVATSVKDKKGYRAYSSGGLVDYTGPAWVDGSPSRPEAFLSVDDTRLIGNLVNLLSDLPALNPNTTPSSISTSNIGDTTINLTVNFDSVSEDYDVERVVDIMKEKIVEAANYTGANVILNKR